MHLISLSRFIPSRRSIIPTVRFATLHRKKQVNRCKKENYKKYMPVITKICHTIHIRQQDFQHVDRVIDRPLIIKTCF